MATPQRENFLLMIWISVGALLILAVVIVVARPRLRIKRERSYQISASQWGLAGLIIALAVGMTSYEFLAKGGLSQTAALFVGLPALIAVTLALTPGAKSVTGMILKGLTIALLASGIFLREGFICIIFAAPLFYAVALVIGLVIDRLRKSNQKSHRTLEGLILLPFLLMSLEGTSERLSFNRVEAVVVEKVVSFSPMEVEASLTQPLNLDQELPLLLRMGFPVPMASGGSGLELGDQRVVKFHALMGTAGDATFQVSSKNKNMVRFRAISDHSEIARWLEWDTTEIRWAPNEDGDTKVMIVVSYKRNLDPAWYFGPLERYMVKLAAGHLLDTMASSG